MQASISKPKPYAAFTLEFESQPQCGSARFHHQMRVNLYRIFRQPHSPPPRECGSSVSVNEALVRSFAVSVVAVVEPAYRRDRLAARYGKDRLQPRRTTSEKTESTTAPERALPTLPETASKAQRRTPPVTSKNRNTNLGAKAPKYRTVRIIGE